MILQNRFCNLSPDFQRFLKIDEQVVSSEGASGHNVEYVLKLAEWLHKEVPDAWDDHLFSIEVEVRRMVEERGLCLTTLMGERREESVVTTSKSLMASAGEGNRGTFIDTCKKEARLMRKL